MEKANFVAYSNKEGKTMSECQTLVTSKKYSGKYVALKSFKENKVVASGKRPEDVLNRASLKGCKQPVIIFVPANNVTHVY